MNCFIHPLCPCPIPALATAPEALGRVKEDSSATMDWSVGDRAPEPCFSPAEGVGLAHTTEWHQGTVLMLGTPQALAGVCSIPWQVFDQRAVLRGCEVEHAAGWQQLPIV